ncbi:hypothetical protein [Nonlabens xiamenensis]|uniref:hypothetical protein n=1 Tax=Nonlabens xiamenensis TaxID=2341043 RepID=UPI000F60F127|nr:hypothetical protein [Nonlabens xiamenensis]
MKFPLDHTNGIVAADSHELPINFGFIRLSHYPWRPKLTIFGDLQLTQLSEWSIIDKIDHDGPSA